MCKRHGSWQYQLDWEEPSRNANNESRGEHRLAVPIDKEKMMDTTNSNRVTPLNAGVKPIAPSSPAIATKKSFVPSPHLTYRPFEELKGLLNAS